MNLETLPPPPTYRAAMESDLNKTIHLNNTTDTFPCEEDIDYEVLRVFFSAGF